MQQDLSHKTAISRTKPSAPLKYLESMGVVRRGNPENLDLLDYGCGKGFDADYYGMDKYDPHYFPNLDRNKKYDSIFCTYVLNVVDEKTEFDILMDVNSLLKPDGKAYFTTRRDMPVDGRVFNGYRQRLSDPIMNRRFIDSGHKFYMFYGYSKRKQWAMFEMNAFQTNSTSSSIINKDLVYNVVAGNDIASGQTYIVSSVNNTSFTFSEPFALRESSDALSFRITPSYGVSFRQGDVIRIDNIG